MKKIFYAASLMAATMFAACGGGAQKSQEAESTEDVSGTPQYTVVDNPEVDLSQFETDSEGYIVIFNGKDFTGWRGYGKDKVPGKWTIGLKFNTHFFQAINLNINYIVWKSELRNSIS
jgi:hypothetical protein